MNDVENARAKAEALESAPQRTGDARARAWAGMNQYLASEAEHARRERQREAEESTPDAATDPDAD